MIYLKNIKKNIKYQNPLEVDELTFKKGKIYSVLGHNGSGKSTLFKILYNIVDFDEGSIDIEGKGFSQEVVYQYMSYNPQKSYFLTGTLRDNFDYLYKYSKNSDLLGKTELELLIKEFNLEHRLDTNIKKLSGGEQAKAQFIRTLLMNKEYILLDEPMASMDFKTIELVEEKLRELKSMNRSVILITHDFVQGNRVSDEIVFMENLKLIGKYKKDEFFKNKLFLSM